MRFEWDPEKDALNLSKHRIGLALAIRVLMNPLVCRSMIDSTMGSIVTTRLHGSEANSYWPFIPTPTRKTTISSGS